MTTLCLIAALACNDGQATDPELSGREVPVSMAVISGDGQSGVIGTELPEPLVVRVTRADGSAVAGQIINWRVMQGGGEPYAGVTLTDANGYSRERWILGPTAGAQNIEARAVNPTTGERLSFGRFSATALTQMITVQVTPSADTLEIGQTVQLTATVRDANGNVQTGRTITWASSNTSVAPVDGSGRVSALAAGNATISATADGQTGQANITVTSSSPPPPPPPPADSTAGRRVFTSAFDTELGSSRNALSDGGRWNFLSADYNINGTIVSSSGLDFPTRNVLRVNATSTRGGWFEVRVTNRLPVPAVGQSLYYRWYMRNTMRDGMSDFESHPIQDGSAMGAAISVSNWSFHILDSNGAGVGSGNWRPQLRTGATGWPNNRWTGPVLTKHTTYRFEMQILRNGESTFQMHVRVYSASGQLLFDDDDFVGDGGPRMATNPTFVLRSAANLANLTFGHNGTTDSITTPFTYGYQGGIAVCTTNWCGPYTGNE